MPCSIQWCALPYDRDLTKAEEKVSELCYRQCSYFAAFYACWFRGACFTDKLRGCQAEVQQQRAQPPCGQEHMIMHCSKCQAGARRACAGEERRIRHADVP